MRSIVFSTVSHLDMYTGEDRKDRWRPLLELLRIHGFKVDKLYFFISHLYRHIVPTLVKDMNNVCQETEIVPVITDLNGVLTYEDIAPATLFAPGVLQSRMPRRSTAGMSIMSSPVLSLTISLRLDSFSSSPSVMVRLLPVTAMSAASASTKPGASTRFPRQASTSRRSSSSRRRISASEKLANGGASQIQYACSCPFRLNKGV